MIGIKNGTAKIDTANTTLLLKLENRPEILYYGPRIRDEEDFSFFGSGTDGQLTTSADDIFCGACVISSGGDGSNRETMLHIVTEDGAATLRPVLCGAEAKRRKPSMRCPLPASYGETECLILRYKDEPAGLEIEQCFSVFAGSDVMAASVRLRNAGKSALQLRIGHGVAAVFDYDRFAMKALNIRQCFRKNFGLERSRHQIGIGSGSLHCSCSR